MVFVAIILMLIVLAGIGYGISQNGLTSSSRKTKYERIKSAHTEKAKVRAEARHNAVLEAIKSEWMPRILRSDRKAANASLKASRALASGKDPSRHMKNAMRRDSQAARDKNLMNKELRVIGGLHGAARKGNPKAQRLVGRVHPQTGHTTGGIGRTGHRPQDHMPKIRQPKAKKNASPRKSFLEILVGKPKPRKRR